MVRPRYIVITALVVAALTSVSACGSGGEPAERTACGMLGFTPATDDGAFDIQAAGVDCATARKAARATRDRRASDPLRFMAEDFSCTGERVPGDGLPGVDWRCERDDAVITFTRN